MVRSGLYTIARECCAVDSNKQERARTLISTQSLMKHEEGGTKKNVISDIRDVKKRKKRDCWEILDLVLGNRFLDGMAWHA